MFLSPCTTLKGIANVFFYHMRLMRSGRHTLMALHAMLGNNSHSTHTACIESADSVRETCTFPLITCGLGCSTDACSCPLDTVSLTSSYRCKCRIHNRIIVSHSTIKFRTETIYCCTVTNLIEYVNYLTF